MTTEGVAIIYALEVECEGLVVRATLNDIDVFVEWEGAKRITQVKLNPYIVEDSNRFEVSLTPMTDDEGKELAGDKMLRVTLLKGEHGKVPDDSNRIATYTWNAAETPIEPGTLTGVWARQFTVRAEDAFGRWAWQDAPAKAPREEDALELVALAEIIHGALSRRDAGAVIALTELRNRELARALDIPYEEIVEEQAALYAEWFASPTWGLDAFDASALAASPYARGRVVRVTDAYGGPPIKGGDGERRFSFQFMATRVAGSWTIVR